LYFVTVRAAYVWLAVAETIGLWIQMHPPTASSNAFYKAS
jgi:hypothetical protein